MTAAVAVPILASAAGAVVSSKLAKKPKVDNSLLKTQEKSIKEQEARLKAQEEKASAVEQERKRREAATKKARAGATGGSLLSGLETGVAPVDPSKRTTLG